MTPLLLAVCLVGSADPPGQPAVVTAEPLPGWGAKFRRTDGWVGADGQ
jgi:hypothetical protein